MKKGSLAFALVWMVTACGPPPAPGLPPGPVAPEPLPSSIESVLFLIGDAGTAQTGKSPVLSRLTEDVERWSGLLPDSSVAVAFLGDNVYPVGVRNREHSEFPQDSTRLWSQLNVLAGPSALEHGAMGLFTSGNHDWGNMIGDDAIKRLANEEAMIREARTGGLNVDFLPPGGIPGPVFLDIGTQTRLIFIDTHFFLQETPDLWEDAFFTLVSDALSTRGERNAIMMAHHPFRSAGSHGALIPALHASGLLYLFKKSGTLIQDLNSPVYNSFLSRLRSAFVEAGGPPEVFAGGHDHSLQLLDPVQSTDPNHLLVSGAGSKLTPVSDVNGLRVGLAKPGYMMLLTHHTGQIDLRIVAGEAKDQHCDVKDSDLAKCMQDSSQRIRTVYAETLSFAQPSENDKLN